MSSTDEAQERVDAALRLLASKENRLSIVEGDLDRMRKASNENAERAHALDIELGKTKRELAALRAAISAALTA